MSKIGDFVYNVAKLEKAIHGNSVLQLYRLYRDYKECKEDAYFRSLNIEEIKGNLDWANAKEVA